MKKIIPLLLIYFYATTNSFSQSMLPAGQEEYASQKATAYATALKEGDILLTDDEPSEMEKTISDIGENYGYRVNHVALYLGDSKVIEAVPTYGVRIASLKDFFINNTKAGKLQMSVLRLLDQSNISKVLASANTVLGKPYNTSYTQTAEGYYCSSLVAYSLKNAYPQIDLNNFKMTFKNKDEQFYPIFITLYGGEKNIPEGALGSHPAKFWGQPYFSVIQDYRDINDTVATPIEEEDEGVLTPTNDDSIYTTADILATFPGGKKAWARYLEQNLNFNLPSKNGAPAGNYTVVVSFIVNKEGTISDVKTESAPSPDYGTKQEAVRVIEKCPNWMPAEQNGRKVVYRTRQTITFQVAVESISLPQ